MIKIIDFDKEKQAETKEFILKIMKKEIEKIDSEIFKKITIDLNNIEKNYCSGKFLLAYDTNEKKIVGTIAYKIENYVAVLKRFYVDEEYREKKIGFKLYKNLEEHLQENHINEIYLVTGKNLIRAHKFYNKNGWKKSKNNPGIYVRPTAILMKKVFDKGEIDMKEKYEILKKLVSFNTVQDKENSQIIDYIESKLLKLNFKTEYKGKYLAMSYGQNPKFGFLGHTDTVEYTTGWKNKPLELTVDDGKIFGLGVCDMKGGIAAIIEAISKIDLSKLKYGIKLYFTYDEEIGFGGINELVNKKENFPEFMIFGEPTHNEMLTGGKGLLDYNVTFKGIKVHASRTDKGKSANLSAIKFFYELDKFYNEKIKPYQNISFEVPYTTMNIGIINGGSGKNSVSPICKAGLDFRTANVEHNLKIKSKIKELLVKYEGELEVIDEISPFMNKIDFIPEVKTANFMTEASLVENCQKVIIGPGPVTAHEVNEYITEESYEKLVEQYQEIIKKICK